MYKYIEDKQFLSRMRSLCGEIMQDLCHTLKEEYDMVLHSTLWAVVQEI